jgi:BolA protein
MPMQERLEAKLRSAFKPVHLEVENESAMHNVPPGSESHFKVIIVSADFVGRSLIEQQRLVNAVLAEELRESIHALTMKTLTPERWQALSQKVELTSPPCRGGSKN